MTDGWHVVTDDRNPPAFRSSRHLFARSEWHLPKQLLAHSSTPSLPIRVGRSVRTAASAMKKALVPTTASIDHPARDPISASQRGSECEERLRRGCSRLRPRMVSIRFARLGFLADHAVVCGTIRRHSCSIFSAVAILQGALTSRVEPNLQRLGGFRQTGAACFILYHYPGAQEQ